MFLFFKIRFNGEVGDVVVGRVTEVRRLLCDSTTSLFVHLVFGFNFFFVYLIENRYNKNAGRWRPTPDWTLCFSCLLSICLEESW